MHGSRIKYVVGNSQSCAHFLLFNKFLTTTVYLFVTRTYGVLLLQLIVNLGYSFTFQVASLGNILGQRGLLPNPKLVLFLQILRRYCTDFMIYVLWIINLICVIVLLGLGIVTDTSCISRCRPSTLLQLSCFVGSVLVFP